jgi:hypothetical protein
MKSDPKHVRRHRPIGPRGGRHIPVTLWIHLVLAYVYFTDKVLERFRITDY